MKHLLTFLSTLGFCLLSLSAASKDKPNVVLVFIDDLGYGDTSIYGAPDIPTPHIDQLAKEGVKTTANYVMNPPCCPSRCSLYLGQHGQRFGKYGMSRGLPIPEDRPTLSQYMAQRGYVTGQIGKWDIGTKLQTPLSTGFDEVGKLPPAKKYSQEEMSVMPADLKKFIKKQKGKGKYVYTTQENKDAWLTDYDGDLMVDFIQRHQKRPFFLYWSPQAVHSQNNEVPERLRARTSAKQERQALAGAIVSVDDQVGKLIKTLNNLKLRENTLVIFSSDNGCNPAEYGSALPYRGGKGPGTQQEGWVRVPAIYSMPGTLPQGQVYDGMCNTLDIYATMAKLTGATPPSHLDGVDLFPYLKGEKHGDAHEYLFWLNNDPDDAPRRHLIVSRWKNWRLYKYEEQDPWKLFDLEKDPQEMTDLASQYPEIVQQLAEKHQQWSETLAPLGSIPKITQKDIPLATPDGYGWATVKDLTP